jgi:hypothetical protein
MRTIGTHDDLDAAIAAVVAAAPDAYELETMSRGLDYDIARVYLSPSTATTFVAMPDDSKVRESVDVTEMTVPELLNIPTVSVDIDNALTALARPGQPLDVEDWHEDLLAEASDAQVVHTRVQVAARTGQPVSPDDQAALVESSLQFDMERTRRELTRLAMARAAHVRQLLDARGHRHGAKAEVARLLKISQQSVQDALAADDRRWETARAAARTFG